MLVKFVFLCVLAVVLAEKVTYDDYGLYKVVPQDKNGLLHLQNLYKEPGDLTFWSVPNQIGNDVSVLASPKVKNDFESSLKKNNVKVEVISENIQEDLDKEITTDRQWSVSRNETSIFDDFNSLEDIYDYFHNLAENNDFVSTFVAGTTFQGRRVSHIMMWLANKNIHALGHRRLVSTASDSVTQLSRRLSSYPERRNITGLRIARTNSRRVFILQGGEVGADWLSPTLVTYLADQLVKGEDPEALAASQDYEWHIIPIVNPDGFIYSRNVDRLWLKNRRIDNMNPTGVDLVRNWNSHWGIYGGSFVNTDPNYIGLGPFSELETRSVSSHILSLAPRITGLLSFRSFGQRLLIPFAQTEASYLYNYEEMITIARRSLGSLAVKYNTQYLAGRSNVFGDGSTGTIGDWAKYRFNPPIVGTYLLRGDSYILPSSEVKPSCEETFDSVMAIFREAKFIDVL